MSAFESVTKGLDEALAFANGDAAGTKVHEVELPSVDVARVRQQTGLSQAEFAKSIGVAKGTFSTGSMDVGALQGRHRSCSH